MNRWWAITAIAFALVIYGPPWLGILVCIAIVLSPPKYDPAIQIKEGQMRDHTGQESG